MKIEDIVLVKEHLRGKKLNYLSTLDDFMMIHARLKTDSVVVIGQIAYGLAETRRDAAKWSTVAFTHNKVVEARFCDGESQLSSFLGGRFDNPQDKVVFDESLCNAYCLDKVTSLGLKMDGSTNIKFHMSYKPVEKTFSQGDVLHNFNGSDYRVLEKLSARNLLLMDERSSNLIVAIGAGMYSRFPKGETPNEDNQTIALEWDHGVYLGATLSRIDFAQIREKYGEVNEIETLEDFRQQQSDIFLLYKKIADNPSLETSVKEAATNAMYDNYCTGREEVFRENLNAGKYDRNLSGVKKAEKGMVR